jgi:hypothetical protein
MRQARPRPCSRTTPGSSAPRSRSGRSAGAFPRTSGGTSRRSDLRACRGRRARRVCARHGGPRSPGRWGAPGHDADAPRPHQPGEDVPRAHADGRERCGRPGQVRLAMPSCLHCIAPLEHGIAGQMPDVGDGHVQRASGLAFRCWLEVLGLEVAPRPFATNDLRHGRPVTAAMDSTELRGVFFGNRTERRLTTRRARSIPGACSPRSPLLSRLRSPLHRSRSRPCPRGGAVAYSGCSSSRG